MLLYTACQSCKEEVPIRSSASTRPDLEMDKGETFEINCQKCGSRHNVHVDDVRAKQNKAIIIAGVGIGLLTTVFLWDFFGAISTISLTIPILIWQQQMNAAHTFNSYRSYRKGRRGR
jgi:DNA-directed RNA polymerase subunit RPC12/RpoP